MFIIIIRSNVPQALKVSSQAVVKKIPSQAMRCWESGEFRAEASRFIGYWGNVCTNVLSLGSSSTVFLPHPQGKSNRRAALPFSLGTELLAPRVRPLSAASSHRAKQEYAALQPEADSQSRWKDACWRASERASVTPTSMEQGWRQNAAFVMVALWAMALSKERAGSQDAAFNSKAARLLMEERLNPKCFTQQLDDLACFWETSEPLRKGENQTKYIFGYKFEDDTSMKHCNLTVEYTARNTTRYTCIFPRSYIAAFVPLEIQVFDGHSPNSSLYARTIWVDQLVFLDPPSNLAVQLMETAGQLNVSWHPPYLEYMGPSIQYEVMVTREGFKARKLDIPTGQTACLIKNLKGQSRYTFAVRAKPDGVSYNGFWSAWSQTVTVAIPSGLDPLILTLSVVLVLIILLLALITLMSHRRFLKKKIWPAIPTPEHEFKDLFTIYKGNFQLWLGHQSTYLWWSQNPLNLEDQPFLVEIVSECDSHKVVGPPPLPPKTRGLTEVSPSPTLSQEDYLVLDEDFVPCNPAGGGSLLLLHGDSRAGTDLALAEGAESPEPSQASSSFEYTMFDPSSESLSPRDHQTQPQLKSNYQMVSDSGISADYSPVGSNDGQTSLYTNLCEGGLQQQSFLPTYIVCS
ncbi:hypothetical protein lerEdw1_002203 [Lerista edwardsae]|nr:hypothetical protein lerEdw1_002203 [Lerista edwardsae]